jgi:IclR family acetate operon transcriptional repressor
VTKSATSTQPMDHFESGAGRAVPDKTVMGRGLMLIEALSRAGCVLSLAELAKTTCLPKSTVHRMAAQLVELGLLDRTEAGFGLGIRIFEWGSKAERQRDLRRIAIPYLSELHSRLGETIHLGVLDGRDVVYIEKIEGHAAVRCPTYVGERRPAHTTALGKSMLAFTEGAVRRTLEQPLDGRTSHTVTAPGLLYRQIVAARETGVSIEVEESYLGVACVASAILDDSMHAIGAISISSPTFRFNPKRIAPAVRDAAAKISAKVIASQT